MGKSSNIISRYGFALILSAFVLVLTPRLMPFFRTLPLDIFLGTIVAIACFFGLGPALVATGIFIVAIDYFFIHPVNASTLGLKDFLRMGVFGATAVLASSLSARLKGAKAALQKAHDELEIKVEKRTADLSQAKAMLEEEVSQRLDAEKEILQISSREQRRLGEDLHDGLSQTLAGLRLLSQDLQQRLLADGASASEDAKRIEEGLGEALSQADVLIRGLYPVELETNGLMAALRELVSRIGALYRVDCRFECPEPVMIDNSPTATHLYRITQEAVMNGIKNGKAKRINIGLRRRAGQVTLSITDDGVGLQGQVPRQGMGLKMMASRARIINARFAIRSRKKGVTRVTCVLQPETGQEENHGS